jgi:cell division protein FtsB
MKTNETKQTDTVDMTALEAENKALRSQIATLESELQTRQRTFDKEIGYTLPPSPAVLEKMNCGLTRQQAETVVAEQARHDAWMAEHQARK